MDCATCEKIKEKKALIVYEDENLMAILPGKPAVLGHIKILPKQHATKLEDLTPEMAENIFFLANFASSAVFDALRPHGTNIIMNESENHLSIDVIPRKENDGMNFLWKPKSMAPQALDDIFSKIKDKTFTVGKKDDKKSAPPREVSAKPEEIISEKTAEGKEKTNYLIKHLQRIP
ncbi:MAG: HIT family protein [archaeon]